MTNKDKNMDNDEPTQAELNCLEAITAAQVAVRMMVKEVARVVELHEQLMVKLAEIAEQAQ